ncbi:hypothetical protein [Paraburkholderia caribensis]|uniref:hypothetical protein n=1 Tax=Paraburkholderia caribensis TaxID=75105 RepID=UPI00078E8352|nr:hypothetical protein [Paraburkholderia caribensis]AMV44338.1 hypothetical protein ATN79_20560 [Paraburkholderia caribensis]
MTTITSRIVGAGLFALDVIVDTNGAFVQSALGGSAGNVLSILAALGWRASPIGTLGDDSAACKVCDDFDAVGADLRFMTRSADRFTPVIYQHQLPSHESGTHRFSFACPICGERRRPQWDDVFAPGWNSAILPSANVFFLDRPTQLGVTLAEHYATAGAIVVFEPSAVGDDPELFRRALRLAHIVKYAHDRLSDLDGFDTSNLAVEIQTCGPQGLRYRIPSLNVGWMMLGAYELPHIRDTAGAGDWCTAGLIYELLQLTVGDVLSIDEDIVTRALAFGQALSSLNCLTEGARGLLAAWSPEKIIHAARQLSALRLRSLYAEQMNPLEQIREPRLAELAADSRLCNRYPLSVDAVSCCLAC